MSTILLAVAALLAILFLFALIMAGRQEIRWFNVTISVFLFFAGAYFCFRIALTAKTHGEWKRKYSELVKQLKTATDEGIRLEFGDPFAVVQKEAGEEGAPLVSVRTALRELTSDRGRAWRHCTITNAQPFTLSLAPTPLGAANPGEPGGAAPPPVAGAPAPAPVAAGPAHKLSASDMVYGFAEIPLADTDKSPPPRFYLGEFRVTAVTETTISIEPSYPLDPTQQAVIKETVDNRWTWAVYAAMPIDSHYAFATKRGEANAKLPIFGTVEEPKLRALFADNRNKLTPEETEAMIQRLMRDGGKADPQIDRPDNVWFKVKFTKAKEFVVDIDQEAQKWQNFQYFDAAGRTSIPNLRKGNFTSKIGEFAVFDQEFAKSLIAEGVCEKDEEIYVRPLSDFLYDFRTAFDLVNQIEEELRLVTAKRGSVEQDLQRLNTQVAVEREAQQKLIADKAGFVKEREAIEEYHAQLEAKYTALAKKLSDLYQTTIRLEREISAATTRNAAPRTASTP